MTDNTEDTPGSDPFASLFGPDPDDANTVFNEGTTDNAENEEPTEEDGTIDIFGKEDSDTPDTDETDWDGKTPFNEHPAFQKRQEQWRKQTEREAARADRLQDELDRYKQTADGLQDAYAKYKQPAINLAADLSFVNAIWEHKDDPTIKEAIEFIVDKTKEPHPKMKASDNKPEEKPASNPVVDRFVEKAASREVQDALPKMKIQPQFHTAITKYAVQHLDLTKDVSQEDIIRVVKEAATEFGWTKETLLGTSPEKKKTSPPSRASRSAVPAAAKPSKKDSGDDGVKPAPAKTAAERLEQLKREVMSRSGRA